jgi:hypothetical protein
MWLYRHRKTSGAGSFRVRALQVASVIKSFMMRNAGSRLSVAESIIRADGATMKRKNMPLIVMRWNVSAALRAVRKSSRLAVTARPVEPSLRRTFAPFAAFTMTAAARKSTTAIMRYLSRMQGGMALTIAIVLVATLVCRLKWPRPTRALNVRWRETVPYVLSISPRLLSRLYLCGALRACHASGVLHAAHRDKVHMPHLLEEPHRHECVVSWVGWASCLGNSAGRGFKGLFRSDLLHRICSEGVHRELFRGLG